MSASEVGRTTRGSSSSLPPASVTTAISGEKPSTSSASRSSSDTGIEQGKYRFSWPVALIRSSSARWISSQIA